MAVSPVAQPNHQRNPLVPVSPVVEQAVDNWAALAMPANLEVDNWAAERVAEPALAASPVAERAVDNWPAKQAAEPALATKPNRPNPVDNWAAGWAASPVASCLV